MRAGRVTKSVTVCLAVALMAVAAACGTGGEATPTPTQQAVVPPEATALSPSPTTGAPSSPAPSGFDAASYFGGKTVTIIVASAPGGGFDTVARIYSLHLPRFLPGNPRFVVQNITGSGQLLGHQTVYESEPDGLTVGLLHSRWFTNQVLGEDVPRWDVTRIYSLGTPTALSESNLFCMDRSVATTWEEARNLGRVVRSGQPAPGNPGTDLLEYLGEPFTTVYGYGGSAEVLAAFDRGELDMPGGYCTQLYVERLYPDWVTEQRVVPIFWNRRPEPPADWLRTLGVEPEQVPYVLDLPGLTISDAQRRAYEVYEAISLISRMFFLPPDTPSEVAAVWETAVRSMVEDAEFQAAMEEAGFILDYGFDQAEFQQLLERAGQLGDEDREFLRQLTAEEG